MTYTYLYIPILAGLVCGAVGCEPLNKIERNYYRRQGAQTAPTTYRKPADSVKDETIAITLVQEAPSPDGQGVMNDWVVTEANTMSGDVLFPQWKARRAGLTRYEVRYLFTLVDSGRTIQHKGYAWDVDVNLKTVSPPRKITDRDLTAPEQKP